jgi:hypothetical protein
MLEQMEAEQPGVDVEAPAHEEHVEIAEPEMAQVEDAPAMGTGGQSAIAEEEQAAGKGEGEAELKAANAPELGGDGGDGGGDAAAAPPVDPGAAAPAAPAEPAPGGGGGGGPGGAGGGGGSGETGGADTSGVDAAVAGLGGASSGATTLLSAKVKFQTGAGEANKDRGVAKEAVNKRKMAESVATGFVSKNAGAVQDLMDHAAQMPDRIMAETGKATSSIDAAIAQAQGMVQQALSAARSMAQGRASEAHAHIDSEHAGTVAAMQAAVAGGKSLVEGAHIEAQNNLTNLEASQKSKIQGLYGTWDGKYRALGPKVGGEAAQLGQQMAGNWRGRKNGKSSILDGPIHDNRMEARAEAASSVAKGYNDGLTGEGKSQAEKIALGLPKDLVTVTDQSQQCRGILDQQSVAALAGLDQSEQSAISGAGQAQAQLHAAVDDNLAQTTTALDNQEQSRMGQLSGYGGKQRDAVAQAGADAAESAAKGASEAGHAMVDALGEISGSISAAQAPDAGALNATLGEAQGQFESLTADASSQLDDMAGLSEQSISQGQVDVQSRVGELGRESVAGIDGTADGFSQGIDTMISNASQSFREMAEAHKASVDKSAQGAKDGFKDVGKQIDTQFTSMNSTLNQNFTEGGRGLEGGLRGALKDEKKAIHTEADKAAGKVKPRWKKVLKVLLIVAVIVVVCVLAGPLAAGLGAMGLGAMGSAVVAGAILGAAAGATIQMGNNALDGKDLLEGVGKAAIVGAIGGAAGGFGAGIAAGLSGTVARIGTEIGIDVIGGVLGELAVGNPLTWEGILLGAAIGAGVGVGLKGVTAVRGRIRPDVSAPRVNADAPVPRVSADAPAPKVDVDAHRQRVSDLHQSGELADSAFHGSNSEMMGGLGKTNGEIVPAAELQRRGLIRKTGEGDTFSGRAGPKEFVSVGDGDSGFGSALSYADASHSLTHYNTRLYRYADLDAEIRRLRSAVGEMKSRDINKMVMGPSREQLHGRLNQLETEMARRQKLPAGDPIREGGPENLTDYPIVFEFDKAGLPMTSRPDVQPGGALGGEASVHGAIDLKTRLRRAYVPSDKVGDAQARLQGVLGPDAKFEVIALEATDALPAGSYARRSKEATDELQQRLADNASDFVRMFAGD